MAPGLRTSRFAILALVLELLWGVSAFSLSPLKRIQLRKRQNFVPLALGAPTTNCDDHDNLPSTLELNWQTPTSQREYTPEETLLESLWESQPFEVAKNLVQSIVMTQEGDGDGPSRLTIVQDESSPSFSPLPPQYQNLFRRAFHHHQVSDQYADDEKSLLDTTAASDAQQLQPKEKKGPSRRASQSFSLEIAYMGEAFCGWQTQPNNHDRPSVQQTLEDWLQPMFIASRRTTKKHQRYNEAHAGDDAAPAPAPAPRANLRCAGRTDAGVHAIGQVARFRTWTKRKGGVDASLEWDKFNTTLNNNVTMPTPDDSGISSEEASSSVRTEQQPQPPQQILLDYINQHPLANQTFRCLSVTPASSQFHPTFGASARAYLYLIDADSIQTMLQQQQAQQREVCQDPKNPPLVNVKDLVQRLNELLEPLVENELDYLALSYGKVQTQSTHCRLFVARAICVQYQPQLHDNDKKHPTAAVCIQLVGNRFLRRMVSPYEHLQV